MGKNIKTLSQQEFLRLANTFYTRKNIPFDISRIALDAEMFNFVGSAEAKDIVKNKKKVALVFMCINPLYWQFASEMVQGCKQFFLPGHDTEYLFWTDIPKNDEEIQKRLLQAYFEAFTQRGGQVTTPESINTPIRFNNTFLDIPQIIRNTQSLIKTPGIHIFPTEPIEWPMPTLLRYHTFLQQEEKLKEYDYVFYMDVDMRMVGIIGDEIFGDGLTAAPHPGYAVRKEYWPPYEPNMNSACYIPRPGTLINEGGRPRFMPFYAAGGFQGGKTEDFIKAMKEMRDMIDHDMNKLNYIPIWNDETAWNKYIFLHPPAVYLDQSYIYPDSLIKEYYEPMWGKSVQPKLVTITKWFSLTAVGGEFLQKVLNEPRPR